MTIQDKDLLLVGVEKNQTRAVIARGKLFYNCEPNNVLFSGSVDLPEGNWEIVGLYPGLTEEQALTLMEDKTLSTHGYFHSHSENKVWENTALESFASRMEALGAYIKNPMGEKPDEDEYMKKYTRKMDYATQMYYGDLEQWNNYQSRTSGQWLVLMKK